jgi:hypothetical protein
MPRALLGDGKLRRVSLGTRPAFPSERLDVKVSTTHQFFSQGQGHSGFFDYAPAMTVLEIAFGIPPDNRNPIF